MVMVTLPTKTLKDSLTLKGEFSKTLSETLFKIGMELEESNEEETTIDIAGAGNRIDAVSLEGIVRIINAYNNKAELRFPQVTKGKNSINVDKSVATVRPYIGAFIVRGINFDDDSLKRMINYQDKIHATFGRDRKMLAMGIYKLAGAKFPLQYIMLPRKKVKFAPLGCEKEMTGEEILTKHEKGKAYAHFFEGQQKVPVLRDSNGKILSMIPITNSNDIGKVEPGKQDVFVEATSFNLNMLIQLLTANALDFADMGGKIESCAINYGGNKRVEFPQFAFDKYSVSINEINSLLGLTLTVQQACKLLSRMLLPAKAQGGKILVSVPRFRSDIVHNVDLIEDISRAYGYDNFEPLPPQVHTFGKKHEKTILFDAVVNTFVGLGFQQVIGMILTSKNEATQKVNLKDNGKFVELFSSRALGLDAVRQSLLPGMFSIISSNKQYVYPQKIFEVGECVELNESEETGAKTQWKTAALIASSSTSFTEIKATLLALGKSLDDYKIKIEVVEDSRFIKGRCAKVTGKLFSGIFGEVDLEILRGYGIEMPCTAIEIEFKR